MRLNETQYDICRDHAERLMHSVHRLNAMLEIYKNRDHHLSFLDSPFMLEMNEDLFELNAKVEYLIRKLDPGFQGEYLD